MVNHGIGVCGGFQFTHILYYDTQHNNVKCITQDYRKSYPRRKIIPSIVYAEFPITDRYAEYLKSLF
jgi:hypothetical protein